MTMNTGDGKTSTMMTLSFVGLRISFILLLIVLMDRAALLRTFTLDTLKGMAQISHSGPTNALYGHEQLADDVDKRRKRRGAHGGWAGNNIAPPTNNVFDRLLIYSEPPNEYTKNWIVSEHNRYRRMVPATDMRMMYWSDELAASAQAHANTCTFHHSRNRINIGENIWAAPYTNYSDAIFRWFDEVNDPRCGCNHAYKHCCGHYIQVVWARSNLVGCGYAQCHDVVGVLGNGHRAVFVCHYSPQGNRVYVGSGQLIAVPAFTWATNNSERCKDCPPDAPACHDGLCYMPLNYNPKKNTKQVGEKSLVPQSEDKTINTNSVTRA